MMESETMTIGALIVLTITSIIILIIRDWRLSILMLSVQYAAIFVLAMVNLTLQISVVKLVAGWMAGALLGLALITSPSVQECLEIGQAEELHPADQSRREIFIQSGRLFHLLAAGLIIVSVYFLARELETSLSDIDPIILLGGLILIGMGLLKISFSADPFMVTLGLLTALAGFEIIYSNLEHSTMVAGLLAVITLGIALVGAYLLLVPDMEENE